jgi:hypothetical protein
MCYVISLSVAKIIEDEWMSMGRWWNDTDGGNFNTGAEICTSAASARRLNSSYKAGLSIHFLNSLTPAACPTQPTIIYFVIITYIKT